MSMNNSNDTIGNRNRGLPACSAVPEPTAPPRVKACKIAAISYEHSCISIEYILKLIIFKGAYLLQKVRFYTSIKFYLHSCTPQNLFLIQI